ncbi:hypothetical protein BB561_000197 [Smittium simulii]|uniref:Uncharacterized protein n=1 Tax=Smittium simulii TaxID=133385 RepID=A0A2T9Z024_9FUNG|nr:hypothetical protein BB561_000197 [Smittium simulii]
MKDLKRYYVKLTLNFQAISGATNNKNHVYTLGITGYLIVKTSKVGYLEM